MCLAPGETWSVWPDRQPIHVFMIFPSCESSQLPPPAPLLPAHTACLAPHAQARTLPLTYEIQVKLFVHCLLV